MGDMFRVVNSSITMLRGDAHVDRKRFLNGGAFTDCLHNCWPGPPDWWNLILYALSGCCRKQGHGSERSLPEKLPRSFQGLDKAAWHPLQALRSSTTEAVQPLSC